MVEVMRILITPKSVGTLFFFRDRSNLTICLVVVVADALTVSFLPLSSTMPHGYVDFLLIPNQAQNVLL
jgi:hypothetical protein